MKTPACEHSSLLESTSRYVFRHLFEEVCTGKRRHETSRTLFAEGFAPLLRLSG